MPCRQPLSAHFTEIEILQGTIFVQRTFDFEDMLANAIGAALTIPFALLLVKKI